MVFVYNPLRFLYSFLGILFAAVLMLLLLVSCRQSGTIAVQSEADTLPHLITKLSVTTGVNKAEFHPNGQLYVSSNTSLHAIERQEVVAKISPPIFDPPTIQHLSDFAIEPQSGLVYLLDQYADAIHVIRDTQIITTILGRTTQPRIAVADEDSGEVYVFYTSQTAETNRFRALVISQTTVITDMVLPAFSWFVEYNPIDGHLYAAGHRNLDNGSQHNTLFVIDNHQVITTIQPLDSNPQLSVVDMAINPENGDVHVLLNTKAVYWDRVNPPHSVNILEAGYKNLRCIDVDPKRELIYVCSWMEKGNYALVLTKERMKTAIPVKKWPEAIAWDRKHDYMYIAHYDPTNLSVIRGTELITTVDIIGYGTMNVVVDERNDYIYTANADDFSISVFGFEKPELPSLWQQFLPFLQR